MWLWAPGVRDDGAISDSRITEGTILATITVKERRTWEDLQASLSKENIHVNIQTK